MFAKLTSAARAWLGNIRRTFQRWQGGERGSPQPWVNSPRHKIAYHPLERVILSDGVNRTLFEEYAAHRRNEQGDRETGWLLLGLRREDEAIVLATLPAGARSDAGVSHVRFNSAAQALGSRIVRQKDRGLVALGVVHTHPGSLRHPSDGDYQGDCQWVSCLRGQEGVFGIGTAG